MEQYCYGIYEPPSAFVQNDILTYCSLCALALDITALTAVVPTRPKQGKWTHGWGTASKAILPFTPAAFNAKSVLLNAFVANTPQVVLSFVYFVFRIT